MGVEESTVFKEDFDQIVDAVYNVYCGEPQSSFSSHISYLYNSLNKYEPSILLDKEDISQELAMRWYRFIEEWYQTKPIFDFRKYIIRRSIWAMRDWYNFRVARDPKQFKIDIEFIPEEPQEQKFKLDIVFLLYGTNIEPFTILSGYERYLLFLKYKEEKNTLQIANIVQKQRQTIDTHLSQVISKLQRRYKYGRSYQDPS